MSRTSLFILVVLIAAAAVAGLVALTRTSAASEVKQPAASDGAQVEIGYRLKQLDAVEANLRKRIAEASKPAAVTSRPQQVIVRRAPAPTAVATQTDSDDAYESEHDDEYESEERDD